MKSPIFPMFCKILIIVLAKANASAVIVPFFLSRFCANRRWSASFASGVRRQSALYELSSRARKNLRRSSGNRDRERAIVRKRGGSHAGTHEVASGLADCARPLGPDREACLPLGQLTAGIAHEIKNPLNFVNNFSAVSVELIDELREALGGVHLDNKLRAEIGEIADMLKGNLDKVIQHGKRADAIVKNMLLHSRQGSGEHRPVDINALVDESLNLAYHGARAEKQGFSITLEKSFDPTAGEVDLFPQEITRVLLNLISNGFYAATKRKAEKNEGDSSRRWLPRPRTSAIWWKSASGITATAYLLR